MSLLSVAKNWSVRAADTKEESEWNWHIAQNPDGGNILQMREFAMLKREKGWTPWYQVCRNSDCSVYLLILECHIPLFGYIWYAPKGPGVTNLIDLQTLASALKEYAQQQERRVFFMKLEPEIAKGREGETY